MAQKGDLMTARSDIRVLDATMRDGGLVNNFRFTDDFINALYRTNVKAGVDYMEFGYKASRELFDPDKFGKWKFCSEEDIRAIVGENNSDMKISVMADVGRCDYKHDIIDKKDSVIDMVRVATYVHQMPTAIEMIEDAKAKGYEVTCNIMAVSNAKEADIDQALEMVGQSPADGIYIVDSYGSLYPEQIRVISDKYMDVAEKYNKYIGMHAHNNQQLAFANTIEATARGVSCSKRCQPSRRNHDVYGTWRRQLCNGTSDQFPEESKIQYFPGTEIYRRTYSSSEIRRHCLGL